MSQLPELTALPVLRTAHFLTASVFLGGADGSAFRNHRSGSCSLRIPGPQPGRPDSVILFSLTGHHGYFQIGR